MGFLFSKAPTRAFNDGDSFPVLDLVDIHGKPVSTIPNHADAELVHFQLRRFAGYKHKPD
jgi:hypothetical protein